MNIPWGSEQAKKFVTNVGLITSSGPHGDNIMSAEWTHQVSYQPGLILISLKSSEATYDNIIKSKEFGVNLSAQGQNIIASVAGGSSGKNVNKIEAFKELGFNFFKAKKIKALMVEGAALNVECRLVNKVEAGDHVAFIGEAVEIHMPDKKPLAYHGLKYWKLNETIPKPPQDELERIQRVIEKHRR